MDTCKVCGGDLGLMGTLGKLDWFKCRNCGLEWSRESDPVECEPEDIYEEV